MTNTSLFLLFNFTLCLCAISGEGELNTDIRRDTRLYLPDNLGLTNLTAHFNSCQVNIQAESTAKLQEMTTDGTKLVEMKVAFPAHASSALAEYSSKFYKPDTWFLAYDHHGQTLLTLVFNYDVVSLRMLTFGVRSLKVALHDSPEGCLEVSQHADNVAYSFLSATHTTTREMALKKASVCIQAIKEKGHTGEIVIVCCAWNAGIFLCDVTTPVIWIRLLYVMLVGVRVVAFIFGPVLMLYFGRYSFRKNQTYVVKYKNALTTRMSVRETVTNLKELTSNVQRQCTNHMTGFLTSAGHLVGHTPVQVKVHDLQIEVDPARLVSEQKVPFGVFTYLFHSLILCRIQRWDPFKTCCTKDMCGKSRSPQTSTREQQLTCGSVFKFLGGLLGVVLFPLPFYIRIAIYYGYEHDEVESRLATLRRYNLESVYQHNMLHYLTPVHPVLISVYIAYFLGITLLFFVYRQGGLEFLRNVVSDYDSISKAGCIRLLVYHVIFPFQRFGLKGLLVCAFYWIIVFPVYLLVAICYIIPVIYITGRMFTSRRPSYLNIKRNKDYSSPDTHSSRSNNSSNLSLPHSLSSSSSRRHLPAASQHLLSPDSAEYTTGFPGEVRSAFLQCYRDSLVILDHVSAHSPPLGYSSGVSDPLPSIPVGIICVVFIYSILVLFAEVTGFCVEICIFTLMGGIANAGSAAKFLMMAFWVSLYCTTCFNNMRAQYTKLNKAIFSFIRTKLQDEINEVAELQELVQENMAFEFFTREENEEHLEKEKTAAGGMTEAASVAVRNKSYPEDNIKLKNGNLYLEAANMILFLDNKDVPRIPKSFFHRICAIEAHGSPGPIHRGLLVATKQSLYMGLFLVFVLLVVMSFGNMYRVSTSNQMLMTLAGGFIPFVARFVCKPKKGNVELSSYSFIGKVHEIIRNFHQTWTIHDLSFTAVDDGGSDTSDENVEGAENQDGKIIAHDLTCKTENAKMDIVSTKFEPEDDAITCTNTIKKESKSHQNSDNSDAYIIEECIKASEKAININIPSSNSVETNRVTGEESDASFFNPSPILLANDITERTGGVINNLNSRVQPGGVQPKIVDIPDDEIIKDIKSTRNRLTEVKYYAQVTEFSLQNHGEIKSRKDQQKDKHEDHLNDVQPKTLGEAKKLKNTKNFHPFEGVNKCKPKSYTLRRLLEHRSAFGNRDYRQTNLATSDNENLVPSLSTDRTEVFTPGKIINENSSNPATVTKATSAKSEETPFSQIEEKSHDAKNENNPEFSSPHQNSWYTMSSVPYANGKGQSDENWKIEGGANEYDYYDSLSKLSEISACSDNDFTEVMLYENPNVHLTGIRHRNTEINERSETDKRVNTPSRCTNSITDSLGQSDTYDSTFTMSRQGKYKCSHENNPDDESLENIKIPTNESHWTSMTSAGRDLRRKNAEDQIWTCRLIGYSSENELITHKTSRYLTSLEDCTARRGNTAAKTGDARTRNEKHSIIYEDEPAGNSGAISETPGTLNSNSSLIYEGGLHMSELFDILGATNENRFNCSGTRCLSQRVYTRTGSAGNITKASAMSPCCNMPNATYATRSDVWERNTGKSQEVEIETLDLRHLSDKDRLGREKSRMESSRQAKKWLWTSSKEDSKC